MKSIELRSWQEEYVDHEHKDLDLFQEVREQLNYGRCYGIYGYNGECIEPQCTLFFSRVLMNT